MRLTLHKALALALLASLIPGRRTAMPLSPAAEPTSSATVHPADPEIAPTPDQYKPTDAPS